MTWKQFFEIEKNKRNEIILDICLRVYANLPLGECREHFLKEWKILENRIKEHYVERELKK